MTTYDLVIIGAGPGGLATAIQASSLGLNYLILEKGEKVFQGIIDSYPRGKKVYPTIPKGQAGPFAVEEIKPDDDNAPVEEYIAKIEACIERNGIDIRTGEDFKDLKKGADSFSVNTQTGQYLARNVVLAFGSNIPVELGVYGEAKTVARKLDNPEDHVGTATLVLGGGNAAAVVVSSLSKAKRAANDPTPVYWGNKMEHFKINKDVARDLGEEILLGGNIKILQSAIPKIGEVDEEGVDRLYIETQEIHLGKGVEIKQGMSFPMKHVIACIGTQGPSPVYDRIGLQQITCTEGVCRIGRQGARLVMLTPDFQTSMKGVYAIGGAVSPAYIEIQEKGAFQERKHPNLIFTAIQDGVTAASHIASTI